MNNVAFTFIPKNKDAFDAFADKYAPKFYKDKTPGFEKKGSTEMI